MSNHQYPLINPEGHAQPGDKIVFTAAGGYERQIENAKLVFTIGESYTVKQCLVDQWITYLSFEEVPGHWNSVLFWTPPTE